MSALALLNLLHRARDAATPQELAFIAVNETVALLPYRQAALWEEGRGLLAVSGVPLPEANAPFTLWLERVCRQLQQAGPIAPGHMQPHEREQWNEWLPPHGYWLPLPRAKAALLLARDEEWRDEDAPVLAELAHAYGHALAALRRPSLWAEWKARARLRRKTWAGVAIAAVVAALIPVPLTVLAPAEVVARDPAVIRAPLDGVVSGLAVRPNQRVTEGQLLFELDDTTLRGKAEVAEKSLAAAEAELRQVSQQAVFDPAAKPKLAAIVGRREQQAAELDYLKSLLERIRVKAPTAGIAVLDDPSEWIGRPVAVGEKVMALAEETDTEIEAWLSPADMIALEDGAAVTIFLNVAPLSPVTARLTHVAYEASVRPDATVAYRARARIEEDDKPRLGLRGTARLSGGSVPLAYWLLRRPIGAVRAWVGW
ncbi:MAG: HlyD family efflux transporter periplasmic adaptor subunit [Magnetospirillum sp.]|nr:HlyD family efflux transporter periplasmic adaptor subunit [Magnetospirillum sp.]